MVPMANAKVAHSEIRQAALRITGLAVFEDIAYTSQRSNERLLPFAIDLSAQPVYVNVNDVCVRLDAHSPDLIEDHRAGDDAACVPAEVLKQNKFLLGQLEDLSASRRFPPQQIQFKIQHTQPRCFARSRTVALEQVAKPGQQFRKCEGLSEIIVPALLQASYTVIGTTARRQDQYRCAYPNLTQLEDQADTVLVRQAEVNDQNVEGAIQRQSLGRFAVSRCINLISSLLQRSSQEALNVDLVFN